ncbi:MAG TPA: GNAT family N-acetyltransferase [Candidatus Poseidoniaceae archaeon]|nr:MAG TPA: GNAT family N-acetyltransferase [Candidatus Poseidoniales archaeon]DAC58357.1 MAG TPA: GNAT family N-acetyltransferase [Candidatus Poseidoniales archaeon]HII22866.1 GNAT family N-acetyltransferase [Candidatus Poseidoniaceae archaeon]HII50849.1 GNAT family N-acetyltransferase [Candidatus Poseidoniaceae archaeon]|tara:strand:- start:8660 stop:9094 length:435 start_codon:yes stop_codon:yes gene_type:complete
MPKSWQSKITELFISETGESYTENTFRMLSIPEWFGNKILIDTSLYPLPESLMGVMWSKPLLENRIRIVALVIDKKVQNNSHGTMILDDIIGHSKSEGKIMIQLEVRKSNIKAQKFYSRHGLKIEKTLKNYYSNEDGFLMVGNL